MSKKDEKGKPCYEAPRMMQFGALARGQAGTCSTGTSATGGCKPTGNFADDVCTNCGNAAGAVCSACGQDAVSNCGNGDAGPEL